MLFVDFDNFELIVILESKRTLNAESAQSSNRTEFDMGSQTINISVPLLTESRCQALQEATQANGKYSCVIN